MNECRGCGKPTQGDYCPKCADRICDKCADRLRNVRGLIDTARRKIHAEHTPRTGS